MNEQWNEATHSLARIYILITTQDFHQIKSVFLKDH